MPPQQPGWGQQPGGMPPQQPGGMPQQPGWGQQPGYAPPAPSSQPASSRRPLLILLLFVLLIGLGVIAYMYTPLGATVKGLLGTATGGTGGTGSGLDITKPKIENVQAAAFQTSALITWTTDEAASSQVEYGRDKVTTSLEPAQPDTDPSTGEYAGVVTHSVTLTGLQPSDPATNIQYWYRVKSKDAAGNEQVSDWKTFNTAISDT